MTIQIKWLSAEITEICEAEARLKKLQTTATRLTVDEDSISFTERTEVLMAVPSIIRALRIVLQEKKIERL